MATGSEKQPTVGVVIPTYNRPTLVLEAVQSVLAQSPHPAQVIVVDDGSPLPQEDELLALGQSGTIRLIQEGKLGVLLTRNRGARETSTDFLLFLDDDDTLAPGAIAGLRQALIDNPEAVAVAGGGRRYREKSGELGPLELPPHASYGFGELLGGNPFFVGAIMMRRTTFDAVGGFEEQREAVQDWDMWLRVAKTGRILVTPIHAVNYRVHANNMSASSLTGRVSLALAEDYLHSLPPAERTAYGPALVRYIVATYLPSQLWHARVALRRGQMRAACTESLLLMRILWLGARFQSGRTAAVAALRQHVTGN